MIFRVNQDLMTRDTFGLKVNLSDSPKSWNVCRNEIVFQESSRVVKISFMGPDVSPALFFVGWSGG